MKKILIVIAILLGSYMIYNFMHRNAERSIEIDAPLSKVWPQVKNFKNWDSWSPWAEAEPTIKNFYSGTDGTVGANASWEGNESGKGGMTITEITENEEMKYHLEFLEPFQSESEGYIQVKENNGKTTVTWGMINDPSFFILLMNLDKMVGKDFERGLQLLKEKVENMTDEKLKSESNLKVQKGTFSSINYIAKKYSEFPIDEILPKLFSSTYMELYSSNTAINKEGIPTALYYTFNVEENKSDFAIALPLISLPSETPEGMELIEIKETESYFIDYYGNYENLEEAHIAIYNYLKKNNLEENKVAIEEYITDPATSENSSDWHTRVSYIDL